MSDSVHSVGSVCRALVTAWQAACALLDHAERLGLKSSPWSTGARQEAERVGDELKSLLDTRGEANPAPYDGVRVETMLRRIATSLDTAELGFVVARVLDDLHWAGFTHDWLAERGHTFVLSEGERYPVAEMWLMGPVGHSARPYHLDLPEGELPHVRRRSGRRIEVVVNGDYAAILDGLLDSVPLTVAAALVNHGNLSVSEVIRAAEPTFEPSDARALVILLNEAAAAEEATTRLRQRIGPGRRSAEATLLVQAGISLLAAAGPAAPVIDLEASVVARPEYADVLSTYVEQAAPRQPAQVARLLQQIEATGVTYDAQWLRLYRAIDEVASSDFDDLAATHLDSPNQRWIRRLPAARFMARRGRLDSRHLPELCDDAPSALRDDVLDVVAASSPESLSSLLSGEGAAVAALLDVAA